jgi:cell division protein FtsJ
LRRGISDLNGKGEVVTGWVIMRFGENPLAVIERVKARMKELEPSLPPGVRFIQGDFGDDAVLKAVEGELGGRKAELVLSDLSPNISGIEAADQARSVHLGELALDFAGRSLQPGGDLVVKAFQGEGFAEFQRLMQRHFDKVYVRKPKASRDRSREVFLVGKRRLALLPDGDNALPLAQEGPED